MTKIQEKRQALKDLSNTFKEQVKSGQFNTINQALVMMYLSQGHEVLRTFKQWKAEGKTIRKGEHALLLWGHPKSKKKEAPTPQDDEYSFFPICFIFSNLQIVGNETI